jgi:hypothetical protein
MKKWDFKGQGAAHGNSKAHRRIGAIGQRTTQAKVIKGKKMPGRLGYVKKTISSLRIVRIDSSRSLLYLKGSVPGSTGDCLCIEDAKKKLKEQYRYVSYPTFVSKPGVMYPDIEDAKPSKKYSLGHIHIRRKNNARGLGYEEDEKNVVGDVKGLIRYTQELEKKLQKDQL